MATRSAIGYIENNKIRGIYCHWDGSPESNGVMLEEHYSDINKIKQLIALGNISILNPLVDPPEGADHSFDEPYKDVVVAYGRDRGETDTGALEFDSIAEFVNNYDEYGCEYFYLFDGTYWWCKPYKMIMIDDCCIGAENCDSHDSE